MEHPPKVPPKEKQHQPRRNRMSGGSTHAGREHRPWKINIYSNEYTEHFNTDEAYTHMQHQSARKTTAVPGRYER